MSVRSDLFSALRRLLRSIIEGGTGGKNHLMWPRLKGCSRSRVFVDSALVVLLALIRICPPFVSCDERVGSSDRNVSF